MRQIKLLLFLSLLILVLLLILFFRAFINPLSEPKNTEKLKSSEARKNQETSKQQLPLKIVATNIDSTPGGIRQDFNINQEIKINFNVPVDNESLNFKIFPEHHVLPKFDNSLTELTIEPLDNWDFGSEYKLQILQATKSKYGISLDKTYEFKFKTVSYSGI